MQNVYEICFYGGLVLAILLLIAAIVLFIVLKIPKVIGELTGSAAKKAMKEMQDDLEIKHTRKPKTKGKCEQDIKGLDTIRIDHYMTEEELISEFGVNGWLSGLSYSGKRA